LNLSDLNQATKHFDKKPITIVNEGLLRYLSFEEKTIVAKNIHHLLKRFGGVWITPDITLKKVLHEMGKEHNYKVSLITGINVDDNRFENEEAARTFFENLGFSIERHSFMEVWDELVSPKNLGMSDEEAKRFTGSGVVYVMRIQK
jgi:O-methyltransferase involved in polyketide biosynthesis